MVDGQIHIVTLASQASVLGGFQNGHPVLVPEHTFIARGLPNPTVLGDDSEPGSVRLAPLRLLGRDARSVLGAVLALVFLRVRVQMPLAGSVALSAPLLSLRRPPVPIGLPDVATGSTVGLTAGWGRRLLGELAHRLPIATIGAPTLARWDLGARETQARSRGGVLTLGLLDVAPHAKLSIHERTVSMSMFRRFMYTIHGRALTTVWVLAYIGVRAPTPCARRRSTEVERAPTVRALHVTPPGTQGASRR